jgi:hypothetical protein
MVGAKISQQLEAEPMRKSLASRVAAWGRGTKMLGNERRTVSLTIWKSYNDCDQV